MVDRVDKPRVSSRKGYAPQGKADRKRMAIVKSVKAELRRVPDEKLLAVSNTALLGRAMVRESVAPPRNELAEKVGEMYSTKALERMWGFTRAAISKRVTQGELLAVKIGSANYFPLFQFNGSSVRPDVIDTVKVLAESADAWTIALWLKTPSASDPRGRTPLEALDAGEREAVLARAESMAHRWSA